MGVANLQSQAGAVADPLLDALAQEADAHDHPLDPLPCQKPELMENERRAGDFE